MKTMGEIISYQRKEKGMTQAELAAKMNVTDKAVSKWERNLSCPDINSVSKLAEILEVTVNELLHVKNTDVQNNQPAAIIGIILKAVPLAMGVAVVVISIMQKIDTHSASIMLGIGLTCLSVGALHDRSK